MLTRPLADRPRAFSTAAVLSRWVARTCLRVTAEGVQNVPAAGPVLLAGNHVAALDGPLVLAFAGRPARALAKSEAFEGLVGRVLRGLGHVPVERGRTGREALRRGLAVLEAGQALVIFPEGTRGAGRLDAVLPGAAYLALRAHAPVVPVSCTGTAAAWPRGHRLPRWRTGVVIRFGPPVLLDPAGDVRSRRALDEASTELRRVLAAHVQPGAPLEEQVGRVDA